MSDQSDALKQLDDAVAAVKKACGDDPECKVLLSALDTAETAAKEYAEGDNDADDQQPKDLKGAADKARQEFAKGRKDATATSK